jgi:hypothetical protein
MATQKFTFPVGISEFSDANNNQYFPDANNEVTIDPTVINPAIFEAAGFLPAVDAVGTTATRPSPCNPGDMFFDSSLNSGVGLPIWRNAANTAWINAAGAAV